MKKGQMSVTTIAILVLILLLIFYLMNQGLLRI